MSQRNPDDDRQIDDLVRAASDGDVDTDALTRAVNRRLDAPARPWLALPSLGPATAAAGFAAMMVIAGAAGYALPGLYTPEDALLNLAFGDAGVGALPGLAVGQTQ